MNLDEVDGEVLVVEAGGRRAPQTSGTAGTGTRHRVGTHKTVRSLGADGASAPAPDEANTRAAARSARVASSLPRNRAGDATALRGCRVCGGGRARCRTTTRQSTLVAGGGERGPRVAAWRMAREPEQGIAPRWLRTRVVFCLREANADGAQRSLAEPDAVPSMRRGGSADGRPARLGEACVEPRRRELEKQNPGRIPEGRGGSGAYIYDASAAGRGSQHTNSSRRSSVQGGPGSAIRSGAGLNDRRAAS